MPSSSERVRDRRNTPRGPFGQVADGPTEFYRDFRNRSIRVHWAVGMSFCGKSLRECDEHGRIIAAAVVDQAFIYDGARIRTG